MEQAKIDRYWRFHDRYEEGYQQFKRGEMVDLGIDKKHLAEEAFALLDDGEIADWALSEVKRIFAALKVAEGEEKKRLQAEEQRHHRAAIVMNKFLEHRQLLPLLPLLPIVDLLVNLLEKQQPPGPVVAVPNEAVKDPQQIRESAFGDLLH